MGEMMSSNNEEVAPPPKRSWSGLLKYGAAAVTIGGLSLHLMGYVAHRTLLAKLGVDPGLFPKSTDWLVINGYYTLADRFLMMLNAFTGHFVLILLVVLASALYVYLMELAGRRFRKSGRTLELNWLPVWAADLVRSVFGTMMFFIAVPVAIIFVFMLVLVPAVLGETAAADIAAKQMSRFSQGCEQPSTCAQLVRDGETIATGFVVDASESHIAIYDVALQRVRTLETAGIEVVGSKPSITTDSKPDESPKSTK